MPGGAYGQYGPYGPYGPQRPPATAATPGFQPVVAPARKKPPIFYLLIIGIPVTALVLVYLSYFRPIWYMDAWENRIGSPGNFTRLQNNSTPGPGWRTLTYQETCSPQVCVSAAKDISTWLNHHFVANVTEEEIAAAFRNTSELSASYEGHAVIVSFTQPREANTGTELEFKVELTY